MTVVAKYRWGIQEIERRRTRDIDFYVYEADGVTEWGAASTDVARLKLWNKDGECVLDLDSAGATANGSVCTWVSRTAPARIRVRFAQDDVVALSDDEYYAELDVVDDSETSPVDAIKRCGCGTIRVLPSAGGDVGKT